MAENRPHTLSLNIPAALVSLAVLGGCAQMAAVTPAPPTTNSDGTVQEPVPGFAQFSDLPFPPGSKMDIGKTFIVGSDDGWYGQTAVQTKMGANGTFDFYKQQLPEYNWQELSSVRAQTSILTYVRDHRVLSIQITPGNLQTTDVLITVSPKEQSGSIAP